MQPVPEQFANQIPVRLVMSEMPQMYQDLFVADGGVSNFNCFRSVWYDAEEKRPGRTQRGLAQNVLRIPSGSSDLFFSFALTEQLRGRVRQPDYYGDILYDLDENGFVKDSEFVYGGPNSIVQWWGEFKHGRPLQGHNYAVGCDISRGTGTTNSVAAVIDVNTHELVGLMVTPYLSIMDFAEKVVAFCDWTGGNSAPLLIWEENGAPEFLKRLTELGYYNLYIKQDKADRAKKGANRFGWRSTPGPNGTKVEVLNFLDASLHEGLKEKPRFQPLRLYDEQTINELASYVWFESKIDVGMSSQQTESSGAKAAHGDRGIAVALANEASRHQAKGDESEGNVFYADSWEGRRRLKAEEETRRKANGKVWF